MTSPQSPEHWIRVIMGALLMVAGIIVSLVLAFALLQGLNTSRVITITLVSMAVLFVFGGASIVWTDAIATIWPFSMFARLKSIGKDGVQFGTTPGLRSIAPRKKKAET